MHENVGLLDMTAFSKFEVTGPGAEAWLDSSCRTASPKATGRIALTYLLTKLGGVRSEFTATAAGRSGSIWSPRARSRGTTSTTDEALARPTAASSSTT